MRTVRQLVILFLAIALMTLSARASEMSAGVARVDLTPPMEMKATLGGYGERMSRPAEGVHDRVFAKALVLADRRSVDQFRQPADTSVGFARRGDRSSGG